MVGDMFESLHRPAPPPTSLSSQSVDLVTLPSLLPVAPITPKSKSPLRLQKQSSSLRHRSPEKQKRLNSAADVYNKSVHLSAKPKSNSKSTLLPSINWSVAWEYALERDKEDKKLQEQKIGEMIQNAKIKKALKSHKKRKKTKPNTCENEEETLFKAVLVFQKWLHRSFLQVKDACMGMHTQYSRAQLTAVLVSQCNLTMDLDSITLVLKALGKDNNNSNEDPSTTTMSLHSLETGLRRRCKKERNKISQRFSPKKITH